MNKSHITWDEEVIAEHDKERGTRQKIDEPPTPYHYEEKCGQHMDEGGADTKSHVHSVEHNWSALNAKLAFEEDQQQHKDEAQEQDDSSAMEVVTEDYVDEEARRHAAFVSKRDKHYNEFQVVQAMRRKLALEEEEEEAEEASEDAKEF